MIYSEAASLRSSIPSTREKTHQNNPRRALCAACERATDYATSLSAARLTAATYQQWRSAAHDAPTELVALSWARHCLGGTPPRGCQAAHSTLAAASDAAVGRCINKRRHVRTLTPTEHVLRRPAMYIGSTSVQTEPLWLLSADGRQMVWREASYVPGLYKIFDEILVNALDNRQRDPSTDEISVSIDAETGATVITNTGRGIPIRRDEAEGMWIPEMVMGSLFSGSNFNDGEKRTVGGRHGFGAKLTNLFSHSFEVQTADSDAGLLYTQRWANNMSESSPPLVEPLPPGGRDFTRVRFVPDLGRFGLQRLHPDMLAIFRRRVHEAAATAAPARLLLDGERPRPRPLRARGHVRRRPARGGALRRRRRQRGGRSARSRRRGCSRWSASSPAPRAARRHPCQPRRRRPVERRRAAPLARSDGARRRRADPAVADQAAPDALCGLQGGQPRVRLAVEGGATTPAALAARATRAASSRASPRAGARGGGRRRPRSGAARAPAHVVVGLNDDRRPQAGDAELPAGRTRRSARHDRGRLAKALAVAGLAVVGRETFGGSFPLRAPPTCATRRCARWATTRS